MDDLLGELDAADAPDLAEFSRAVTYAFGMYWAGRYGPLTAMLPRLLTEAAAATHGAAASGTGRAADLAAQIYRIAASTLLHLGAPAATDLLTEAATAAQRTGVDRTDYDVVFGPSNVMMQATDCSVVAEDYVAAAEVARTTPRDSALPLSTRSRHLADVAYAHLRLGHDRAAESALLTMARTAPEWTAHQQLPRMLVGELLIRGRPSVRLRELSRRLNVARATRPS